MRLPNNRQVKVNIIQKFFKTKKSVAIMIDDANRKRRGGDKVGNSAGSSRHSSIFENILDVHDSQIEN